MARISVAVLLVLALAAAAMGVDGFLKYTHRYTGTAFNPASVQAGPPRYYYLDWRGDIPDRKTLRALVGADGVFTFEDRVEYGDGPRRDPLHVVQACLGLYDQLLDSKDAEIEAILRRQVAWLLTDAVRVLPGDVPVWPQRLRFPKYGLGEGPWVSALTQGQVISLLVRVASYTGDPTYAEWARRAARAFTRPGVPIVWQGKAGEIFFEEFPCVPPSHVLNGCLFAWLGLWDFARLSGDPEVRRFCLESLERMEDRIAPYEMSGRFSGWTRYDMFHDRPTSPTYQEMHAALAESMHAITGEARWGARATRWRAASADPRLRTRVFAAVLGWKIREPMRKRAPVKGRGLQPNG